MNLRGSQCFRYCTANEDLLIVTVHHTEHGAFRAVKANSHIGLNVFKFPKPWAVTRGDILPTSAVSIVPTAYRRPARKRIGE